MDRVAIRPGEDVALLPPPGRYQREVVDVPLSIGMRTVTFGARGG